LSTAVQIQQLPPLILHPFSGGAGTTDLLDGSLASLTLEGLGNSSADAVEEEAVLRRRVLAGRYQEVRMLLFLGKDIFRWMEQCVDHMRGSKILQTDLVEQSFAALLVDHPPESVVKKLQAWGVTDRRAVFSRAIGIHSLFQNPPPADSLSPIFLKNYHRYADHAYICFQHASAFIPLDGENCPFELYASEEYSRILSDAWGLK
jgi:hypothetical protein